MKILYLTDGGFHGYASDFNFGKRPHGTWIQLLNAFHCNYDNIDSLKEKFDVTIMAALHENRNLIQNNYIEKLRLISKKIGFSQEGAHNSFFSKTNILNQVFYVNIIQNVDFILCHNDADKTYYETLYNKPCYINRQMICDVGDNNTDKEEKIMLPGAVGYYYGNFDGYLMGLELGLPIYTYKGHTYTSHHDNLDNINYLNWELDYIKFNKHLQTYKYCLYLLQNPIGGSFPLQCAMNKVACVAWNNCETAKTCFPDLVCDYGNFNQVRNVLKNLTDKTYYTNVVESSRKLFLENYNFNDYTEKMLKFLGNL